MSVFRRRPAAAVSKNSAKATLAEGLLCTVCEGDMKVVLDMPIPLGGTGRAPTPGFHARAAISGCVAIGIKMTAIRLGIELKEVNVSVEMEFDDSALFGMGDATAAPLKTNIGILLRSDADPGRLNQLVDVALAADPYFLALRDPQVVLTQVEIE